MTSVLRSSVACVHCGLPSPPPARPDVPAFCCNGCRGAYELIRGWGLEDYYAIRDDSGASPATEKDSRFDDLDHPSLLGASAPVLVHDSDGNELLRSRLCISGLHCAACLWLLERAPERVDGWLSSRVRMHERTIEITYDPATVPLSKIGSLLQKLGYEVSPLGKDSGHSEAATLESRQLLVDIAIAGFCAANAMWLAIALYAGAFTGIEAEHANAFRIAGVVLGCIAVLFPGRTFFRGALASIRTRTPHMDLPVAIGLAAGLGGSLYGLLDANREIYFDSIAALVFFLLVGRWLQMRQQRRAGDEVAGLIQLAPAVATLRKSDGTTERVTCDTLSIGDTVLVAPGESVPVDGVVVDGKSSIDRSLLTGESVPVEVVVGSLVEAGTDNLQSPLEITATLVGSQTRLSQLTSAVADAAASRTPIVQLANRIGGWFVAIVLVLAIATWVYWWNRDPSSVVGHVVALLIVACPCALALATPLAIAASIGRLASRKVLVRSGECLERIVGKGTIFFDKTGTLTTGRMKVIHWHGDPEWLAIAASAQTYVRHPIAAALIEYAKDCDVDPAEHSDWTINVLPGIGIEAQGTPMGTIQIGNANVVSDAIDEPWNEIASRIRKEGGSPIFVTANNSIRAVFGTADAIRDESRAVVKHFQDLGWKVGILSGDHRATVAEVAAKLGVDAERARGEMMPDEKLDAIRKASLDGIVMMVGDGLNDAAALAAADVGVAIRGGVNASLAAAPIIIGDGRLGGLVTLVSMAGTTRRVILRNLALSISYNVVAVALAMNGMITPLIAAILMPISSLTVILATIAGVRLPEDLSSSNSKPTR
ncbi:Copper-exporting P-type ATPase A [Rubripirellula amarantea]|uniref:Copper-exporting P-type ATPase A n=2 Tax=Rubripirellula amarantea TaxID=2527999 RepID=A0A5C5WMC2_9BACT|nr:Copper-exporting P-type ATPase A [Rubripirellula amarantea]